MDPRRRDRTQTNNGNGTWVPYTQRGTGTVTILSELFQKGLFVVAPPAPKPNHPDQPRSKASENKFIIGTREFVITSPDNAPSENQTARMDKTRSLLEKMLAFNSDQTHLMSLGNKNVAAIGLTHQNEVYIPLIMHKTENAPGKGVYINVQISPYDNIEKFSGFKNFVTAVCLFGASLEGCDDDNYRTALIKHNIIFAGEGQKITHIDYDPSKANPYEEALFSEFKMHLKLVHAFSTPGEKKKLIVHLPWVDYILFGVELFLRGRITLAALDDLIVFILQHKDEYIKKITALCDNQIELQIQSPFENLFSPSSIKKINSNRALSESHDALESGSIAATTILRELNLSTEEIDPRSISLEQQKANEKRFVHFCLEQLKSNNFLSEHREVWEDFITIRKDKVNSLEDLFNLANAIMIAIASSCDPKMGKSANYQTCSLLPLSEKQIPIAYDQYTNIEDQAQKRIHIMTEIAILKGKAVKLKERISTLENEASTLTPEQLNKKTDSIIAKLHADEEKIHPQLIAMDSNNPKYGRLNDRLKNITKQLAKLEEKQDTTLLEQKKISIKLQIDQLKVNQDQIQNEIQRLTDILQLTDDQKEPNNRSYPKIFEVNVLDRYIPYGHKIALPFYGNTSPGTVSDLISKGAIKRAKKNLGLFAEGKTTPTFQQFIENANNIAPSVKPPK